jgi:PAS domain S-box-containing protein
VKERLERRITLIFGSTLAVFFLIGLIQVQTVHKFVDSEQQVRHAQEILEKLEATQSRLDNAEAGARGYVITGDQSYLEPFDSAVNLAASELRDLRKWTAESPSQQKRLDALDFLVPRQLAELRKVVDVRRAEGFAAASHLILTGGTGKLTKDFHEMIGEMKDEEHQLLAQRNVAARISARKATLITTLGTIVGSWLLILAGFLIYYYIRAGKKANVSHALSTQLLKGMPEGVSLSDDAGVILYVNPAAEAMYGYKPGELIGENITALGDDEPKAKIQFFDEIRQHMEIHGDWRGELVARKRDHTTFVCYMRISPLEVSDRHYWISVHQDAAERDRPPIG